MLPLSCKVFCPLHKVTRLQVCANQVKAYCKTNLDKTSGTKDIIFAQKPACPCPTQPMSDGKEAASDNRLQECRLKLKIDKIEQTVKHMRSIAKGDQQVKPSDIVESVLNGYALVYVKVSQLLESKQYKETKDCMLCTFVVSNHFLKILFEKLPGWVKRVQENFYAVSDQQAKKRADVIQQKAIAAEAKAFQMKTEKIMKSGESHK